MKSKIKKEISNAFTLLNDMLSSLTDKELDTVPFENSWTAGELAENILKTVSGIPQIFTGGVTKMEREVDEKVKDIKRVFFDFNTKMIVPKNIEPTEKGHDKLKLIAAFQNIEKNFIDIVDKQDLTLVCTDVELPGFGNLTKYEWLSFGVIHTQRHNSQLNQIIQKLKK